MRSQPARSAITSYARPAPKRHFQDRSRRLHRRRHLPLRRVRSAAIHLGYEVRAVAPRLAKLHTSLSNRKTCGCSKTTATACIAPKSVVNAATRTSVSMRSMTDPARRNALLHKPRPLDFTPSHQSSASDSSRCATSTGSIGSAARRRAGNRRSSGGAPVCGSVAHLRTVLCSFNGNARRIRRRAGRRNVRAHLPPRSALVPASGE